MHLPQQARHTRVYTVSTPRQRYAADSVVVCGRTQTLSEALSHFMGAPAAGARQQDVVKRLWAHIREHGLEARTLECRETAGPVTPDSISCSCVEQRAGGEVACDASLKVRPAGAGAAVCVELTQVCVVDGSPSLVTGQRCPCSTSAR